MRANIKKIFFTGDHASLELKSELISYLHDELKINKEAVEDLGPFNDDSVDYPDYAIKGCEKIQDNLNGHVGVFICGTGIGISIAANKQKNIRAALVQSDFEAEMSRLHNDANVLCLGARIVSPEQAKKIVETFLETEFEGGRHQKRVDKIKLQGCTEKKTAVVN